MCIADLVTRPERSVIRQSFDARERLGGSGGEVYDIGALNADGFGLGWYSSSSSSSASPSPCVFTDVGPAWNNRNLVNLASKTSSSLVFAHVRAAGPGMGICTCSCHPFEFGRFLFMHNGQVSNFGGNVRRSLLAGLRLEAFNFALRNSCSDSALAFAVFIDQLEDGLQEVSPAQLQNLLQETIRRVCAACDREPEGGVSLLNFVVSDGKSMAATRYVHVHPSNPKEVHDSARAASLYFGAGSRFEPEEETRRQPSNSLTMESDGCNAASCGSDCSKAAIRRYRMARTDVRDELVIITSEPLTERRADWISIPQNHLVLVSPSKNVLLSPIVQDKERCSPARRENAAQFERVLERMALAGKARPSLLTASQTRQASMRNVDCNVVTTTSPSSAILLSQDSPLNIPRGMGSGRGSAFNLFLTDQDVSPLALASLEDEQNSMSPFPEHTMSGSHESALLTMATYKHYLFSADSASPGYLCVWDLSVWKRLAKVSIENSGTFATCVDSNLMRLYASCSDNSVIVWQIVETDNSISLEEKFKIFFPPIGHIISLALDEKRQILFTGSQDACMRAVNLSIENEAPTGSTFMVQAEKQHNCGVGMWRHVLVEGRPEAGWRASDIFVTSHLSYIHRIIVCENFVASGSSDGVVKIWDRESLNLITSLVGHRSRVMSLTADEDSKSLFSGGLDGTIRVWDMETFVCRRVLMCGSPVLCVMVARDTRSILISSHTDESISVWDLQTMQITDSFRNRSGLVFNMGLPVVSPEDESSVNLSRRVKSLVACATSTGAVVSFNLHKMQKTAVRRGSGSWRQGSAASSMEQRFLSAEKIFSEALAPDERGEIDLDDALLQSLHEIIRIRTISAHPDYHEECFFGAKVIARLCEKVGCADVKLCYDEVERTDETIPILPVVLATLEANAGVEDPSTLIIYGHYDVVGAVRATWNTDPWEMIGKDGYLYGRGVTDDKGPLLACLFAAKAVHAAGNLRCNVTFIIEGQEESGLGLIQRGFANVIQANSEFFHKPCGIVISNNYWLDDKRPCLTYGMRGVIDFDVEVQGSDKDLHAGVHGGPIYEPADDLMALMSTFSSSPKSLSAIEGLGDDIRGLDPAEIENFERINLSVKHYTKEVGVPKLRVENPTCILAARWCEPSLSISSLTTSNAGQHFRRIPKSCSARLSLHFVPDQVPEKLVDALRSHLENTFQERGSVNNLQITVRQVSDWWLGDTTSQLFKVAEAAIQSTWGVRPLLVREGGSYGGISAFLESALSAPVLHLPMGQATDSAHLPNERISVENLLQGKRVVEALLSRLE